MQIWKKKIGLASPDLDSFLSRDMTGKRSLEVNDLDRDALDAPAARVSGRGVRRRGVRRRRRRRRGLRGGRLLFLVGAQEGRALRVELHLGFC